MSGAVGRENQIFDTLQAFNDSSLEFVVVDGYAVSAFQHRFSVDADLVIREADVDEFVTVLEEHGFEAEVDRALVYGGRYLAYEKNEELPITIDVLVNALLCRQTDARWSYDYFQEFSVPAEIRGMERTVEVPVPERELQIAVKLHSGRLTDARDVVALAENADIDRIREHLDRGDQKKLETVLKDVLETIESNNFTDAFKGVFVLKELPGANIETIENVIQRQREISESR